MTPDEGAMSGNYLRYLIPLEAIEPGGDVAVLEAPPESRADEPAPRAAEPESVRPARPAVPAALTAAETATLEPVADSELLERLAGLEAAVRRLQERNDELALAAAQHLPIVRRGQHELDLRLGALETRIEASDAAPVRVSLGSALLVPLIGLGLTAAFHFGLYQLFLHMGEGGSRLANLAAETLLGFHMATETAPHVYFYWVAIELLWTSLLVVLTLGIVLRRLRRAAPEPM
jgi:hypothetical protein